MKVTDLVVDVNATLGRKLWVVEVIPAYEYKDGKRTEKVTGYRYMTVLPERKLDKIAIRIDGPAQLETPNGYIEAAFEGLEVSVYWKHGEYDVSVKATKVKALKENT